MEIGNLYHFVHHVSLAMRHDVSDDPQRDQISEMDGTFCTSSALNRFVFVLYYGFSIKMIE